MRRNGTLNPTHSLTATSRPIVK